MSHYRKDGPVAGLPAVVLLLALSAVLILPSTLSATDWEVCADCHEEVAAGFAETPHGVYFSGRAALSDQGCVACHGSGAAHIAEGGDPDLILNPGRHDQFGERHGYAGAGETCLNCHNDHTFDDWPFSNHSTAGITCSDCHMVHGTYEQSKKKAAPELCYDCHSDVRAAGYMPSHHPVAEGKMECMDCHAVHGGQASLTMENTGRELCFSCHSEIEGPFVYEHAPVEEDCMICHTPHGSVAENLLKQSEPALCLNCHQMHFHTSGTGEEGEFTPPYTPGGSDRTSMSTADAWKVGMLTKCTQCHAPIHGSDLPSQTIPTGGNALTR
jgi:DmsE family decaheme c-type cytochrome